MTYHPSRTGFSRRSCPTSRGAVRSPYRTPSGASPASSCLLSPARTPGWKQSSRRLVHVRIMFYRWLELQNKFKNRHHHSSIHPLRVAIDKSFIYTLLSFHAVAAAVRVFRPRGPPPLLPLWQGVLPQVGALAEIYRVVLVVYDKYLLRPCLWCG